MQRCALEMQMWLLNEHMLMLGLDWLLQVYYGKRWELELELMTLDKNEMA